MKPSWMNVASLMKTPLKLRPEILLHPNIPKPLHGLAPRVILGDKWWNEQRQDAYRKTGFRCAACGVPKDEARYHRWLEAHELYLIDYAAGSMTFLEVVALCHACHNYIHSGRMEILVEKGEMSENKQKEITRHGNKILKDAGLRRPIAPLRIAPWEKWHLVLNGKKFRSKFKSYEDWCAYYGVLGLEEM